MAIAATLFAGELGLALCDYLGRRRMNSRRGHYRCRATRQTELDTVRKFWTLEFGDEIATPQQVRDWYARNPDLFWIVHEPSVDNSDALLEEIVGSFSAIPVTKKGRKLLERDASILELDKYHVSKAGKVPSAVYIGGVIALNWRAKAEILAFLEGHLYWIRKNGVPLYARAVRQKGLELLRDNNFRPVAVEGLTHIYRLEASLKPKHRRKGRGSRVLTQRSSNDENQATSK